MDLRKALTHFPILMFPLPKSVLTKGTMKNGFTHSLLIRELEPNASKWKNDHIMRTWVGCFWLARWRRRRGIWWELLEKLEKSYGVKDASKLVGSTSKESILTIDLVGITKFLRNDFSPEGELEHFVLDSRKPASLPQRHVFYVFLLRKCYYLGGSFILKAHQKAKVTKAIWCALVVSKDYSKSYGNLICGTGNKNHFLQNENACVCMSMAELDFQIFLSSCSRWKFPCAKWIWPKPSTNGKIFNPTRKMTSISGMCASPFVMCQLPGNLRWAF